MSLLNSTPWKAELNVILFIIYCPKDRHTYLNAFCMLLINISLQNFLHVMHGLVSCVTIFVQLMLTQLMTSNNNF